MSPTAVVAAATASIVLGTAAVWATDRAPYPYRQRHLLDVPLPLLTPRRLLRALEPHPGQRLLEIGPGTGLFTVPVARRLQPLGRLDVIDVQREMLDHTRRRLAGVGGVSEHLADAAALPFADGEFDAAFLVTVLGETGDPARVLRELARVLRPGGRLVIGEFADRHHVSFPRTVRDANAAGLHLSARSGPPLDWFATFTRQC